MDDNNRRFLEVIATKLRHFSRVLDVQGADRDVVARVAGSLLDMASDADMRREMAGPLGAAGEDDVDDAVLLLESFGYSVAPGPETAELVTKAGGAPNGEEVKASKAPYEKPELVEFGNVRDLTRGAGTKGLDALPVGTRHG